jgi:2-hydroxychromene-2-carboxylate isomerase
MPVLGIRQNVLSLASDAEPNQCVLGCAAHDAGVTETFPHLIERFAVWVFFAPHLAGVLFDVNDEAAPRCPAALAHRAATHHLERVIVRVMLKSNMPTAMRTRTLLLSVEFIAGHSTPSLAKRNGNG